MPTTLAETIKAKAYESGYDLCGIIKAEPFAEFLTHMEERIAHFPHSRILYDRFFKLGDPRQTAEWARTIVVCGRRYNRYQVPEGLDRYFGKLYLFNGLLPSSPEYADSLAFENKLQTLGLQVHRGDVPLRWAAVKAGLGQFGRNNFVYTKFGSWVIFTTWLIDRELDYDPPVTHQMGCPPNCTRCVDACPTKALSEPNMMDGTQCIPLLTYLSPKPQEVRHREPMGTLLYGCDICQNACPRNHNQWTGSEAYPGLDDLAEYLTLEKLLTMDEKTYLEIIQPRFVFIGKEKQWLWKCNVLRAMANSREERYRPYIAAACKDEDERVREMAEWALERLGDGSRKDALG